MPDRTIESVATEGMSVQEAAVKHHVPRSKSHDAITRTRSGSAVNKRYSRPPKFSTEEEHVIVDTLVQFANNRIPLTRKNSTETISMFVETFPSKPKTCCRS